MKAVRWGSLAASSLGNERMCPWCFLVRFLGKNPRDPLRGASNLRWDMMTCARIFIQYSKYNICSTGNTVSRKAVNNTATLTAQQSSVAKLLHKTSTAAKLPREAAFTDRSGPDCTVPVALENMGVQLTCTFVWCARYETLPGDSEVKTRSGWINLHWNGKTEA